MGNYLYNGVELPALPEWDKEKYPCAAISVHWASDNAYTLYMSSTPPVIRSDSGGLIGFDIKGPYCYTLIDLDIQSDWPAIRELDGDESTISLGFIWTNTDIHYKDNGTLYLAASDPIPVTTPEPLDPASMLMGWLVGRRIASQRKRV